MTEKEKQATWDRFQEKRKSERELLTHNGVFSEQQAEVLQTYLDVYFFRK